jgi:predicted N-formylglutamate amidohydrolase
VLIGDHTGDAIPQSLGTLGLSAEDRARHIAVDIGIEALGVMLAERLGAPFLRQRYSRLVIDCNRDPAHPGSVAQVSDGTAVRGNTGIAAADRQARIDAIFAPYQNAISAMLDAREAAGLETILVSLHSFTPRMNGADRPWHLGVLHDGHEDAFSFAVLDRLRALGTYVVGDNEPYRMNTTDYTVPRHAFARGLPYLELEVRQDLIAADKPMERQRIADMLRDVLTACVRPSPAGVTSGN